MSGRGNHKARLDKLRVSVSTLREARDIAEHELHTERAERKAVRRRKRALVEATRFVQGIATRLQDSAHSQISEIVTKCLAIFPDPYTFHIVFDRARGRTAARLVFRRGGEEVDPTDEAGGGVVNVASFALRVAALVLVPGQGRLLLLDEPFHFVQKSRHPALAGLFHRLASELGLQLVLTTHEHGLISGRVVEID